MKIVTSKTKDNFHPVDVTITLETQKELDAFGSLFNAPPVINALGDISGDRKEWTQIHRPLFMAGADVHQSSRICNVLGQI